MADFPQTKPKKIKGSKAKDPRLGAASKDFNYNENIVTAKSLKQQTGTLSPKQQIRTKSAG